MATSAEHRRQVTVDEPQHSPDDDRTTLHEDPLPQAMASDPDHAEPLVRVRGHLGRSGRDGAWRLYLDDSLAEYVEIDEDDVVHSIQDTHDSDAAPTTLWLRAGTALRHRRIETRTVAAEFLQGEFADDLASARAGGGSIGGPGLGFTPATPITPYTPPIIYATWTRCPGNTIFGACRSFAGACDTFWGLCTASNDGGCLPQSHAPSGCLSLNMCP